MIFDQELNFLDPAYHPFSLCSVMHIRDIVRMPLRFISKCFRHSWKQL